MAKIDVSNLKLQQAKKVALAYSGGLDSALALKLLPDYYGAEEVYAVTVDVGLDEQELEECRSKAELVGVPWTLIDKKDEFAEEWIAKALRANSDYEGYPVSTSMTRQLIAREVALYAVEHGCDAVCEGSTGKGNDQFRMHNVFKLFGPDLKIICPVRDFNFTRDQEKDLCRDYGIPFREGIGDDRTMWCRSIGSGEVDNLKMQVAQEDYLWYKLPENAPDEPAVIDVTFEEGLPVDVDGKTGLANIVQYLNVLAGEHSIGKIDMFEDGIMGLKSREVYEGPAAKLLIALHQDLEHLTLTKEEVLFKQLIDSKWAELVYHGMWYHPLKEELDAFIAQSQKMVSGKYKVQLYKGNITILERESKQALFRPDIRSLASASFDQRDSEGACKINGLKFEILGTRRRLLGE